MSTTTKAVRSKRPRDGDGDDASERVPKLARAERWAAEEAALAGALFGGATMSNFTIGEASAKGSSAGKSSATRRLAPSAVEEAAEAQRSAESSERSRSADSDINSDIDIDSDNDSDRMDDAAASSDSDSDSGGDETAALQPAWLDDDDAVLRVNLQGAAQGANGGAAVRRLKLRKRMDETRVDADAYLARLRTQHALLARNDADWALLPEQRRLLRTRRGSDSDSDSDSDDDKEGRAAASTARVLSSDAQTLPSGRLLLGRVHDLTSAEAARGVVRAIDWHAGGEVVAVASLDRTLRLYALSAHEDEAPSKLQSVRLDDLALTHAQFTRDGSAVLCSGSARHLYLYDVQRGALERIAALTTRDAHVKLSQLALVHDADLIALSDVRGAVQLLAQRSRQWVAELQCGAALSALAVRQAQLLCATRDGELLTWDLRHTRRCVERWRDHGATHTTALAASAQWLATGSDAGVVNVYRSGSGSGSGERAPQKALMQLTTEIGTLAFNHDSQLLAMASPHKSNALRFVHLPSCTVFSNFPKQTTPLSRVSALAFAPNSAHVAIGTARGKVLLYRLHHYH